MTQLQMWDFIIGFFLPIAIAAVQRTGWPDAARATAGFFCCLVVGFISTYLSGQFSLLNLSTSILIILVTAITTYKGLWQKTGVAGYVEGLANRGGK